MIATFQNGRVSVVVGDLTLETTDAIVNAANSTLLGGGGVDGAIHRRGGPSIYDECLRIRNNSLRDGLSTGDAVITGAGNLVTRFVIHTVGPIFGRHDGKESELLASCYARSLAIAAERELRSIAFPSISCGAFGFPRDLAAPVASRAIMDFLETDDKLNEVRLVFYDPSDAATFLQNQVFGKYL